MRTSGSRVIAAIAAVGLVVTLTACTSSRSVESFCETLAEHKTAYLDSMNATSASGGLESILGTAGAIGDLKLMWQDLADVAPSDIQSDVEAVRDAWQKQEDAAASGDYAGAIVTALLNSGSMSRVDSYIQSNCDGNYAVTNEPENASEEEPEPEPEPMSLIALSDTWADRDGYTYKVTFESFDAASSKDTANAKPGEAEVSISLIIAGSLENTTADRNAPAPTGDVLISPVWAASSLICQLGVGDDAWSSNVDSLEGNYCSIAGDGLDIQIPATQILDGETLQITAQMSRVFAVPEAEADAIIALLTMPEAWVASRDTGDNLLTDCLVRSGGYYVSTSTKSVDCTCGVGTNC